MPVDPVWQVRNQRKYRARATRTGADLVVSNQTTSIPYRSNHIEEIRPRGLTKRLDNLIEKIPEKEREAKEAESKENLDPTKPGSTVSCGN